MEKKAFIIIFALAVVLSLAAAVFGSGFLVKTQNKEYASDPDFYRALGDEYVKQGKNLKATVAYEQSLVFGYNEEVESNLAVLYHNEGFYSDAITHLSSLAWTSPENPSYHYDLAVNLVDKFRNTEDKSLDDLYEALAEYGKAEQLEPGYAYAKENIAVLKGILKIE